MVGAEGILVPANCVSNLEATVNELCERFDFHPMQYLNGRQARLKENLCLTANTYRKTKIICTLGLLILAPSTSPWETDRFIH